MPKCPYRRRDDPANLRSIDREQRFPMTTIRPERDPERPVYVISVAATLVERASADAPDLRGRGPALSGPDAVEHPPLQRERHPADHLDPAPDPGARREPRGHPHPVRARGAPRRSDPRSPLRRRHQRQRDPTTPPPTRRPHPRPRRTTMAKRPSTPVDEQPTSTTGPRELPLVALRETVIFPEMIVPLQVGREKSVNALNAAVADGGPIALVTQRQRGAGGHRRSLRALRHRHAGQDRPGRAAPGRHRPGDRPGPGPPARPRLHDDRAVPPGHRRGAPRREPRRARGPGADAHGPGPDRAVRRERRARSRRRPRSPRATSASPACWPTWSPTARTCRPSSARRCSRRSTSPSASSSSPTSSPTRSRSSS